MRRFVPTQTFPAVLELMGQSIAAERARAMLSRAAAGCEPVLISGEAGLDQMAVARAIHDESAQVAGPLISIDCALGDSEDLERQLFGSAPRAARGAPAIPVTPAIDDEIERISDSSRLRASFGGTLVLANVDELPGRLQTRVARVLRDGEVETDPGRERIRVDVRVIATTGSRLENEERQNGHLRRELQTRFKLRMELPPLRQRCDDIPLLIGCVAGDMATACGTSPLGFSRDALTLLSALPWRRNLDELREVSEVFVRGSRGTSIELEDVLRLVPLDRAAMTRFPATGLREVRTRFEREYIASILYQCRGRMDDAARALGIQRTNLYRKVRQLGISRVRFR